MIKYWRLSLMLMVITACVMIAIDIAVAHH